MRVNLVVLVVLATLFGVAGEAMAQGPGGGRGSRGGFGDPSQFFDRMSGGKAVWTRAEITDERGLKFFDKIAQSLGVTNGQITRDQFSTGMQQMRGNRGGPPGPSPSGAAPGSPSGAAESFDQYAERRFKEQDRNGDGFLNTDEASKGLRADFARWDTNKDGLIDLNEYKAYLQDRQQRQGQNDPGQFGGGSAAVTEPEEDRRPVVYRAGNLPKELPAWFSQLDTDKDGQVGMYEWRKAGKSLEEFEEMDRNNDGFLTVEEVLYHQALAKKAGTASGMQVAAADNATAGGTTPSPSVSAASGPSRFGGGRTRTGGGPSGGGSKGKSRGKKGSSQGE